MNFVLLDVVIGMVFVYLLASIFCSAVYEMIAAWLNRRGDMLRKGVTTLLGELEDSRGFLGYLFGRSKETSAWHAPQTAFARAVFEHPLIATLSKPTRRPSYIAADRFALALGDVLCEAYRDGRYLYTDFANTLAHMPESALKRQLEVLHRDVQGDAKAMQQAVERWYAEMMDRLSGWYKRETQVALFITGLLAAMLLNIDSLAIAQRLWVEPQVREVLVANAQAYAQSTAPGVPLDVRNQAAQKEWEKLEKQLPLGWTSTSIENLTLKSGALAFAGWLITALAISFGSTFWFDTLSKLVSLRSAGARAGGGPSSAEPTRPPQGEPTASAPDTSRPVPAPVPAGRVTPFDWAANDLEGLLSSKHVLALQQALRMPAGSQSGVLDAATRQQIAAAESQLGWPDTGEVSRDLLDKLGIQIAA